MATEHADASDAVDIEGESGLDRPRFRGCVVCYSAEMTYYGIRKLGRRFGAD